MSTNCVRCVVNKRIGFSLYCAECEAKRPSLPKNQVLIENPCGCFGRKDTLEVYDDDQGKGPMIVGGERVMAPRHTTKERCATCGETALVVRSVWPSEHSET